MDTLKEKIKYYREKKDISKSKLAKDIGVSPSYITRLENGEKTSPSLEILIELSKALEIPLYKLNSNAELLKYNEDNQSAINILSEFLKCDVMQDDCKYHYESLMLSPGIDDIYLFIQDMIKLRYSSNMKNEDMALELLLRFSGSSTNKFDQKERKILKDTIHNYIKGMIEFKRINK